MKELFTGTAAPSDSLHESSRLTIVSDWQRTLSDVGSSNYALLEFLSDGVKAGHRVIITSASDMDSVSDLLELVVEMAREEGYNVIDAKDFEKIRKSQLMLMELPVDYAFDDEPIATQRFVYANPGLEIRVYRDYSMSPLSLDMLRSLCLLPKQDGTTGAAPPDCHP